MIDDNYIKRKISSRFNEFEIACRSDSEDNEYLKRGEITINIYVDVVARNGEVINLIEFLRFKGRVRFEEKAKVRIIVVNFEGDIIINNLDYHGKVITLTEDSSRVRFHSGSDISVYTGDYIKKEEKDGRITYYLINKEHGKEYNILSFNRCLDYKTM